MIKKVTIQDIAAEMGLSRNTVAKALSNSETVAYDTRLGIVRKAWEMGYQKMNPSVLEEYKIVENRADNKTVIILAKRELSVFWNSIIVGISDELNRFNCRMRLNFISSEDEENLVLPRDFYEDADAVILMSIFNPRYTESILEKKLPTVFLDSPAGDFEIEHNCDSIICEGASSVRKITDSLIKQGLTSIGFIGDVTYCESIRQRFSGYCSAMADNGVRVDPGIIFTKHLPEMYSHAEVEEIIGGFKYIPQAIVCSNDDIALKCIRALVRKGLKCPGDVAVTGFDNEEALTQAEPKLTTVLVQHQMLGRRLVQQLLWRMSNPAYPVETVLLATKPIYRRSSMKTTSKRQ